MKCPKCGLEKSETAQRCDCGYDFHRSAGSAVPEGAPMRIRSTLARNSLFHTCLEVNVDEPHEITGILQYRNKRLSGQLWIELHRVGVTKEETPTSGAMVAGELRLGITVQWLSSAFSIGIKDQNGRLAFGFSGTGQYSDHAWTGKPRRAFELLASLPASAGPDAFWQRFSADGLGTN